MLFDLEQHTTFGEIVHRIEHMRVVPFDLRSFSQLLGSTLGSVSTVLPLLELEGPMTVWLQILTRMLES